MKLCADVLAFLSAGFLAFPEIHRFAVANFDPQSLLQPGSEKASSRPG